VLKTNKIPPIKKKNLNKKIRKNLQTQKEVSTKKKNNE
jgi:hypothetical protein